MKNGKSGNIIILGVNDFQSKILPFKPMFAYGGSMDAEVGGLPRVAGTIKQHREKFPGRVLAVVMGVDPMGPLFYYFRGRAEFKGLSLTGFDIGVTGEHEFDLGPDLLADALDHASFPFVCANLAVNHPKLADKFESCVVRDLNGMKVGVFGLSSPSMSSIIESGPYIESNGDPVEVAGDMVRDLKGRECDIIVAITHIGIEQDRLIAREVAGIHAILGAHSHTVTESPEIVDGPGGWRTIVVQAGTGGASLGRLKLSVRHGELDEAGTEWALLIMDSTVPCDPVLDDFVNGFAAQLEKRLVEPVGRLSREVDARAEVVVGGESALGNFLADALRWRFEADIAFMDASGIQGNRLILPGEWTYKTLYEIQPFFSIPYVFQLTGEQVHDVLEISGSALVSPNGDLKGVALVTRRSFLHISGLRVVYDLTGRPDRANPPGRWLEKRKKVREVSVLKHGQWVSIDEKATYRVVVPFFLAIGGCGYAVFREVGGYNTTTLDVNVIAEYIRHKGGNVHPEKDGRIRIING